MSPSHKPESIYIPEAQRIFSIKIKKCAQLCILLLLFGFNKIYAQVITFRPSVTGGCSPLTVEFANTSSGFSQAATYNWDFGNGNTSQLKDAAAIFLEEKDYTITLTVKDGDRIFSKSQNITVYKKPVVDFTASATRGCLPFTVNFTSSGMAPGLSCNWDFGDGTTGNTSSAGYSHTYNASQKATVSLTVTNSQGCNATMRKISIIDIRPEIKAEFAANKTVLCLATDPVKFTNTSTGPGTLSYLWEMTDGSSSTDKDLDMVFKGKGTYSVKLTVSSSEGCSATSSKASYINVANYTSDFELPALSCTGSVLDIFNRRTPFTYVTEWLVDGLPAYSSNGDLHQSIPEPGEHTITLINTFETCVQKVTKTITVMQTPKSTDFLAIVPQNCGAPVNVELKDTTSSGDVTRFWNFFYYGNGTNPGLTAPDVSFTFPYNAAEISLKLTSKEGCSRTIVKYLSFYKPPVEIGVVGSDQYRDFAFCGPTSVTFKPTLSDIITDYKWTFDDGGTSTDPMPTHLFTQTKSHSVRLDYTTKEGCKATSYVYGGVTIMNRPVADFTLPGGTSVCGNNKVTFQGTVHAFGFDAWYIDDKYSGSGSYDAFEWRFTEKGKHTVRRILRNAGCSDTVTKVDYVDVSLPIVNLGLAVVSCYGNRDTVTFTHSSVGGQSWKWDFGDGETQTINTEQFTVKHVVKKSGEYIYSLTVTDGTCEVKQQAIFTYDVVLRNKPVLSAPKMDVCYGEPFFYAISDPPDPYYYSHVHWPVKWEYGDGTSFKEGLDYYIQTIPAQTYQLLTLQKGKQGLRLIVNNINGCPDTTNTIPLNVKECTDQPPLTNARFGLTTSWIGAGGCLPVMASFNNTSTNYTRVKWDFGDGTTADNVNYPQHIYSAPGKFIITLFVYDATGLTGTWKDSVIINQPEADLKISKQEICIGEPVTVTAETRFASSLIWDFGDGTLARDQNNTIDYKYTRSGTYIYRLILKDAKGCSYGAGTGNSLFVRPNPVITFSPGHPELCKGAALQLTASGAATYHWSPAPGLSDVNIASPLASPASSITYKVTGKDDIGCSSESSVAVEVHEPFKLRTSGDISLCIGDQSQLKAEGASAYKWIDNISGLSNSSIASPVVKPTSTGQYTVVGYDSYHCFTDTSKVNITVNPLPVVDAGEDLQVLAGTEVKLEASSMSDIREWNWSPATYLNCTDCKSAGSLPKFSITYTVTGKDGNGCVATDKVNIKLLCGEELMSVPNTFTPDGNGKNDLFVIKGLSEIKHMTIYSRWGSKVFERSNFNPSDRSACWDGKSNGAPVPTGSYVYFIEVRCPQGTVFTRKGVVVVVR